MISRHLPHDVYQLAATYTLGEPIRVYRTTKRPQFKVYGWSIAFTSVICIIAAGTQIPFRFTQTSLTLYGILVAIMLFVAIMFLGSLLLLRRATVYICSAGFIFHHKSMYKIVRYPHRPGQPEHPYTCCPVRSVSS
ncbi:DUF6585 family protein [Dictyobacter vulcani]|uniref:DUF6585 family protein n=1 Tax=Dictyobacter vulcani TaxID=2607529 RepID=UPI003530B37A